MVSVAIVVSANTERVSAVAYDRFDWISFALGTFFIFTILSVASSIT